MKNIVKYATFCCFVSLTSAIYAENVLPELPSDIQAKPPSEQTELLTQIGQFSYQVLLEVPAKGLQAQRTPMESVINARKWLETS